MLKKNLESRVETEKIYWIRFIFLTVSITQFVITKTKTKSYKSKSAGELTIKVLNELLFFFG